MDTGEHAGVAASDGTSDEQPTEAQGPRSASHDAPTYGGTAYPGSLYGASQGPTPYTPQWAHDSPPAGYPWTATGTGPYGAPPTYPPIYDEHGGGGRGGRGRGLRTAVLGALALLLGLGGGVAIGAAAFGSHPASSTSSQPTVAAIGSQPAPTVRLPSDLTNLQQSVENVARAVEPSVVEITSRGGVQGGEAIGSGDILTANGYIVTNDHVVDGFANFTVTLYNGKTYSAQLVGTDPQDDLAVIKVSATNLTPISFADSSKVTVGEFVVAYGTPLGERNTATFGTVTGLNKTESEAPDGPADQLTGMIQESAPIAPGNSGGALVDLHGQLIGIPTLGEASNGRRSGNSFTNIGFAIASNAVKTAAQQLIQNGHVNGSSGSSTSAGTGQGFIGIQAQDVTPQVAAADGLSVQSGVLVAGFAADTAGQSPAQQAGLRVGDVITAVNGQSVANGSDLASILSSDKPGTRVTLTVVRGTTQLSIQVTLGDRPANAG